MKGKEKIVESSILKIIECIGENHEREGLKNTPKRVAKMFKELTCGYGAEKLLLKKAIFKINYDEMVIVKDIEFYSLCEHHLLPFFGVAHIAYVPKGKVIGLSKIPRIVDVFSKRLQIQERLTQEIAEFLKKHLAPYGVGVVIEGIHTCMMMRGVKKAKAKMITSSMLGIFKTDQRTRMEFLNLIGHSRIPDLSL